VAVAGDTVLVREKATPYFEKLVFPRSGDATAGFISLEAQPGERPVLDGTGVPGAHMVAITNRSWVRLRGFEIQNHTGVSDGSGVRIEGAGTHIEILDNEIHDIRGSDAMGITVYGTSASPIAQLVIDGNDIHDCEPYRSEALTLNGNVTDFAVTNNVVRDVNNIGIDLIGGETDINPDPTKVARNGVVRGNLVVRAREQGGGYAGGIYVDGGRDLVIENNVVTGSDLGIEVGAENAGVLASNVRVRNNVLYANEKAGLVFGGFSAGVGRVVDSSFTNNTLALNDTLGTGTGELWIQYAEGNLVSGNVVVAGAQARLVTSEAGSIDNALDYNVYFAPGPAAAAEFVWNGTAYAGLAAFQAGTALDTHSRFADPGLADAGAGDVHLAPGSPAIDAGDPAFVPAAGEVDVDGGARLNGARVDCGADESTACGDGVPEPPEECDDGNATSGDGCDVNCTTTRCGNGIPTSGEQCDDGNAAAGDCCGPTCQLDAPGTPCDDGNPCTHGDGCDAGACAGAETPRPACTGAGAGSVLVKNRTPDTRDLLRWTWTGTPAALGDPVAGGADYTLCLYDGRGVVLRAEAPAGGTCGSKPCWKPRAAGGFTYKDRDRTPDGIVKLLLKTDASGSGTFKLKAKGALVEVPALPMAQLPVVTLQLVHDQGGCWQTAHDAPPARNDAETFQDD
jgi:cysteine-rich repeat protein